MTRPARTTFFTLLILWASAHEALAQTPSAILPVKLGQTVWVTTSEGFDMKGVISALTPSSLEVSGEGGTKHFVLDDIRRVAKRDGNTNGFLIGAAVGALPFVLGAAERGTDVCYSGKPCSAAFVMGVTLSSAAFWGAIGALVDNAIDGRTTIYERPQSVVHVTPLVTSTGLQLRGSIRW